MSDVFISYAHLDNMPRRSTIGWVTRFYEDLVFELQARHPHLKVYFDEYDVRIGRADIDQQIESLLKHTEIFVAIFSPSYDASDYCGKEIVYFSNINRSAGRSTSDGIVAVEKSPMEANGRIANLFPNLAGAPFKFYDIVNRKELPFVVFGRIRDEIKYYDTLLSVLNEISLSLRERNVVSFEDKDILRNVFVAESGSDVGKDIRSLRGEIESHDILPLPKNAIPRAAAEAVSFIDSALEQCDNSVHVISRDKGATPPGGDGKSLVELQLERALRRAREDHDFSRLIWIHPSLGSGGQTRSALVSDLWSGKAAAITDEIFEGELESFKATIFEKLGAAKAA